jgi:endonuclease III
MPRPESKKTLERRQRVAAVLPTLKQTYPDARCSLAFTNPLELIVATILSAQCTDERVNLVTKDLFRKYRTADAYARAGQETLEKEIQSTGFYRNKAKSLRAMAAALVERHGGKVPATMDELTRLAGVGRKTANVVLGNAYHQNVGVTVDTHVTRVSNRLDLIDHAVDAVKIEQDLMKVVPQDEWTQWSHLLIHHGRAICQARKPKCEVCPLLPHCPAGQKFMAAAAREQAKAAKAKKPAKRAVK